MPDPNGRTHEPALRELVAEVDGLRALVTSEIAGVRGVADERDRRYEDARTSDTQRFIDRAVAAEKAADRAVSVANEFRGQLKDQADTFARKEDVDSRFTAQTIRLDGVETRFEQFFRKEDANARLTAIDGRMTGIEARLEKVESRLNTGEGRGAGIERQGEVVNRYIGILIALAAVVLAAISLVVRHG